MKTFHQRIWGRTWNGVAVSAGLCVLFACATPTEYAEELSLNPEWGKPVSVCQSGSASSARVWFFKQWHLAPSIKTTDIEKSKSLPQYDNQSAIYGQLNAWISAGKLKTVVAEGCGGSLNYVHFNGWDLTALKAASSSKSYDSILTSIPLKLEAKYGDKIHTLCGDDEALIKQNSLAFSDARGELGFLTRLVQNQNNPDRAKLYLDGVIDLYHLPAGTTIPQAIARLKLELQKSVDQVEQGIQKRNEHLADVISAAPHDSNIAVVFGGAHAPGVERLLEKKGMNCTIVEPSGYQDDETQLLQKLKELLAQLQSK
jgi:hypothetical protein